MKKLSSYKIYLKLKPHYVDIELPSSSPDVSDKHFQYRLKVMWSATGNWWVNRNYFWNIARKFLRASQLTRPWRLFSSQPSSQIHPQSIFSLMKKPRDFAFRPQKLFHIFFRNQESFGFSLETCAHVERPAFNISFNVQCTLRNSILNGIKWNWIYIFSVETKNEKLFHALRNVIRNIAEKWKISKERLKTVWDGNVFGILCRALVLVLKAIWQDERKCLKMKEKWSFFEIK
jgi:hypothetical protein